ncbi:MAG: hypothetical protein ABIK92_12865 [Pseudomonadota bacterium]
MRFYQRGAHTKNYLKVHLVWIPIKTQRLAFEGCLVDAFTHKERNIEEVDSFVLATWNKANIQLYHALRGNVGELYAGDCLSPREVMKQSMKDINAGRSL